jgi:putative membrane protein
MPMIPSLLAAELVRPQTAWSAWTLEPPVAIGLAVGAIVYANGYRRLRGRGGKRAPTLRAWSFAAGWIAIAVALISPLDAMSEALFSAHMVQHLLLIAVAPPLLVIGRPIHTSVEGLGTTARRRVARLVAVVAPLARRLERPAIAWIAFTVALWGWHQPSLYRAALEDAWIHAVEHAWFLGTSILVWAVALRERPRATLGALGRALFLLATAMQSGLLGAVLLFASIPLYPEHRAGAIAWGLTPLQDQQLAGALMWIPPSGIYLVAAAWMLARWFRRMEVVEDRARPRAGAVT